MSYHMLSIKDTPPDIGILSESDGSRCKHTKIPIVNSSKSHCPLLTHLYWYDKMSLVFEEVVGIDGNNSGLVWLGHICKYHIHHPWTPWEEKERGSLDTTWQMATLTFNKAMAAEKIWFKNWRWFVVRRYFYYMSIWLKQINNVLVMHSSS